MILIPIGRDDAEIRRHAWVSYAILALNVLVFVVTATAMRASVVNEIEKRWRDAFRYYATRPYLQPPPELAKLIPPRLQEQIEGTRRPTTFAHRETVRTEQAELDAMVAKAVAAREALPYARYGYIPAEGGVVTLFTSMFMHAGMLHLLGNLLFFFFSGPFVEDVFGRPLFAALYLIGGVIAALTYAARDASSTIPLVGASGAIAAVMGAYLFRFYASKIELLFVPFLWRPTLNFRFFVPAFVVLPLWFGQQLLEMQSEAGSGIAFSAHVGGFVFGFCFAVAVGALGFEQKFVEPKVKEETTWEMDERLAQGLAARQLRNNAVAKELLTAFLRDQPQNGDALRIMLDVALEEADRAAIDNLSARLLAVHAAANDHDSANALIAEIVADSKIALPQFFTRAAAFAERVGDRDRALLFYQRLYQIDPNAPAAVGTLVKASALFRANGDNARARALLERARAHPHCTPEWLRTIEGKLAST